MIMIEGIITYGSTSDPQSIEILTELDRVSVRLFEADLVRHVAQELLYDELFARVNRDTAGVEGLLELRDQGRATVGRRE